jgi:hypothetical protein
VSGCPSTISVAYFDRARLLAREWIIAASKRLVSLE